MEPERIRAVHPDHCPGEFSPNGSGDWDCTDCSLQFRWGEAA